MKANKKIIALVGSGSANMFAAVRLIDGGVDPRSIVMIDKGESPYSRTREGRDLVHGFAGAGLWSDGKMVFSPHGDMSILTDEDREKYHKEILSVMSRFVHDYETITTPTGQDVDWGGLKLLQSSVYHLGTEGNVKFGKDLYKYLINLGVTILFNINVDEISDGSLYMSLSDGVSLIGSRNAKVVSDSINIRTGVEDASRVVVNDRIRLFTDKTIVSIGKTGVKQFKELADSYNLEVSPGAANIGFRFEMKSTKKILDIVENYQYDYKLSKTYDFNDGMSIDIRTFCVNNGSAYIVEEITPIDGVDYVTYNGHGYGMNHPEKRNDMSNFGIIARIKCNDSWFDADKIHREYICDMLKGKGHIVPGESVYEIINYVSKLVEEYGSDDDVRKVFDRWYKCLEDFMPRLVDTLGINTDDGVKAYIPEIKMSGGIIKTNSGFSDINNHLPNVHWCGDCCTGVVGIVPSAVTGMKAADSIIDDLLK